MKKIMKITYIILIMTLVLSCSKKRIVNMEIEALYDKRDNSYTISYPEYNKQYPKFISLKTKGDISIAISVKLL